MEQTAQAGSKHRWHFWRAGGFDQVRLDSGADLLALDQLDQKLWVALSCPTRGLEFDARTLDLIDTDHDGRIRAPEILAATRWACERLKSPDALLHRAVALPLAAINDSTPEGRQLLSSARQILSDLGKKDTEVITLEETADTARIFAQTKFNGDGIIPPESADDAQVTVREVVELFLAAWGGGQWRPAPGAAEQPHEAGLLLLDSGKAERELGWRPAWSVTQAVTAAANWYEQFYAGAEPTDLLARCRSDIADYSAAAAARGAAWTAVRAST